MNKRKYVQADFFFFFLCANKYGYNIKPFAYIGLSMLPV